MKDSYINRLLDRLSSLSTGILVLGIVCASELITAILNIVQSYLVYGSVHKPLLAIGAVDGFVVALLLAPAAIFFLRRHYRLIEKARLQEAAARAEHQYQLIAESISDVVWVLDLQTEQVTYCSSSVERMRGYSLQEVMQQSMAQLFTPRSFEYIRQVLPERMRDVPADGFATAPFRDDLAQPHKNGGIVWTEVVSTIMRNQETGHLELHAVSRDMTLHRAVQQEMRELNERYQSAIAATGAVVYQRDYLNSRYVFMTDGIVELTGYKASELTGDVWKKMVRESISLGEAANLPQPTVAQLVREGKIRHYRMDLKIVTRTGQIKWLSDSSIQLPGEDGKPVGSLGIIQDITERKRTEEALRQSQKLESIGTLAGGIAHDFNNLLNAILAHSQLALESLPPGHEGRRYLEKSLSAIDHAANLTRQLLAYSGKGRFSIRQFDMNEFLRGNASLLELSLPKTCTLKIQAADVPLPVRADTGQVQQVLLNLLINAGEALNQHSGTVILRTSEAVLTGAEERITRVVGRSIQGGKYARIDVEDTGIGIGPEVIDRIFDPFYSTKFTGRGLGLAAALGIVRGHEGGMQVESTPDAGTTVSVFFPLAAETAKPGRAGIDAGSADGTALRGRTVLIIDDEPIVRQGIVDILASQEIATLEAGDGIEGLREFQEHRGDIRLILLDLSMPRMDGEQAFHELKRIDPSIRIILSSGYSETELGGRFDTLDIEGFLQKPYRPKELIRRVRKVLDDGTLTHGDESAGSAP